uniref:ABC transporter permease n=1 Tax=Roseitalea sp. MMSF_3504 TaxID=3046716 RepID=UPI00273E2D6B
MEILDRKLLRDLGRLWAQVLAVALVMACGVMTLILALGATRSLEETRAAFYERYLFGNVFATANRAPEHLKAGLTAIEGVAAVETRIVKSLILDIEGMVEPAAALAVSLPDFGEPSVNRLYIRRGRLPEPTRPGEVAVVETFAEAHGFAPGDTFGALINGKKRQLTITGIVLSPEFIYAIGPGDMVPDQRRYGILFMSRSALEAAFDMTGAFNDVSLTVLRNADMDRIIEAVDERLDRYGGAGAHDRDDQISHAFLQAELDQLQAMAGVIPPIFLFISAFLVNMILSRLIALEREQIGLLKAVGFSSLHVAWHYAKLVIVICAIGLVIGGIAGSWVGGALTRLYGEFFSFPFLVFAHSADLFFIAGAVTVAAALAGAASAIRSVVALPPAVAMRPPAPAR